MAAPALACFAHLCFITYVAGQYSTTDKPINFTANLTELTNHEDRIILLNDSRQSTTTKSNVINNESRRESAQQHIPLIKSTRNSGDKNNLTDARDTKFNNTPNVTTKEDFNTNLNKILMEHDRNSGNAYERVLNSLKVLYGFNNSLKAKSLDDIAIDILEEGTKSRTTVNDNQFDKELMQKEILRNQPEDEDPFADYERFHLSNKNERNRFQELGKSFQLPKTLKTSSKHNVSTVTDNFIDKKNMIIPHITTETLAIVDTKHNDGPYENANYILIEPIPLKTTSRHDVNFVTTNFNDNKKFIIPHLTTETMTIVDTKDHDDKYVKTNYILLDLEASKNSPQLIRETHNSPEINKKFPNNVVRQISLANEQDEPMRFHLNLSQFTETSDQTDDPLKVISDSAMGNNQYNPVPLTSTTVDLPRLQKEETLKVTKVHTTNLIKTKKMTVTTSTATSQNILTRAKTPFPYNLYPGFRQSSVTTSTTPDPISQFYASVAFPDETYIASFGIRMICHLRDVQPWEKLHDVAIIFAYEFSVVAEENQDELKYLGTPIDIAFKDFSQLIRQWNEREARGNLTRYCHQLKNRQQHWHELNLILDHFELFMDKRSVKYIVEIWDTFKAYPNTNIDLATLSTLMRTIFTEIFMNPYKRVLTRERSNIMHRVRRLSWLLNSYAKLVKYPCERIKLQLSTRANRRRHIRQVMHNSDNVDKLSNSSMKSSNSSKESSISSKKLSNSTKKLSNSSKKSSNSTKKFRKIRRRKKLDADNYLEKEKNPPIMGLVIPVSRVPSVSPQKTSSEETDDSLWHAETKNMSSTVTSTITEKNLRKSFGHDLKHIRKKHPRHYDKYIRHHYKHHHHKSKPVSKIKKYEKMVENFFNDHKKHKQHGKHKHYVKEKRRRPPKKTGSYLIDRYIPSTTTTTKTNKNSFQNFMNEKDFLGGFLNNMLAKKHSSTTVRTSWTPVFPQTTDNVMDLLFSIHGMTRMTTQEPVTPKQIQYSVPQKEYEYQTESLQTFATRINYPGGRPGSYPISYNDVNTGGKLGFYNDVNTGGKANIQNTERESNNFLPEYNSVISDPNANIQNNGMNTGSKFEIHNIGRSSNNSPQDYNFNNSDAKTEKTREDGREHNVINTDVKGNIENSGKGSNNPVQEYNYGNTDNKVNVQNKDSKSSNPKQEYNYNTQNNGKELSNPVNYNSQNMGVNNNIDKESNNPIREYNYINPDGKLKYQNNGKESFNPTRDVNAGGKVNIGDLSNPMQEHNYMNTDRIVTIQSNDRDYNNFNKGSDNHIQNNGKELNFPIRDYNGAYNNNMKTNGKIYPYNSGRDLGNPSQEYNYINKNDKVIFQNNEKDLRSPLRENHMYDPLKDNIQISNKGSNNTNKNDEEWGNRDSNSGYSYMNIDGEIDIRSKGKGPNYPTREHNYLNADRTANIQNNNDREDKRNVNNYMNTDEKVKYQNNSREISIPLGDNSNINTGGNVNTLNYNKKSSNSKDTGSIAINTVAKDIIEKAARELSNKIQELNEVKSALAKAQEKYLINEVKKKEGHKLKKKKKRHQATKKEAEIALKKAQETNTKTEFEKKEDAELQKKENDDEVTKKVVKKLSKNDKDRILQELLNDNLTSKTTRYFRSPKQRVHSKSLTESISYEEPMQDFRSNIINSNDRNENSQERTISDKKSIYPIQAIINRLKKHLKDYSEALQGVNESGSEAPQFETHARYKKIHTSSTTLSDNESKEIFIKERIDKQDFDSYEYATKRPYQKRVDIDDVFYNTSDRSEVSKQQITIQWITLLEMTTEKVINLENFIQFGNITKTTNSSKSNKDKGRSHISVEPVKDELHQQEQNIENNGKENTTNNKYITKTTQSSKRKKDMGRSHNIKHVKKELHQQEQYIKNNGIENISNNKHTTKTTKPIKIKKDKGRSHNSVNTSNVKEELHQKEQKIKNNGKQNTSTNKPITKTANSNKGKKDKGRSDKSVEHVEEELQQQEQNIPNDGKEDTSNNKYFVQNNNDPTKVKKSNYEMIWRVEREREKLIHKYNKLFSKPKVIRSLIKIYSNKMKDPPLNIIKNNRSGNADTENILRKITELSSYSDEELSLKLNLHNAFHGKHIVDTRRRHISSESDMQKIDINAVSDHESDVEHVLKENIYKTFGYDTNLRRIGNDTRRFDNFIVPQTWEVTPDYFINITQRVL